MSLPDRPWRQHGQSLSGRWECAARRVRLSDEERVTARKEGQRRFRENQAKHYKDRDGKPSARSHVIGAGGEIGTGRCLNIPWKPTRFKGDADLGENIEVKTTTVPGAYLRIRPTDRPGDRYVLSYLDSAGPDVELIGWLPGSEARVPRYWVNGEWHIPADDLWAFEVSGD